MSSSGSFSPEASASSSLYSDSSSAAIWPWASAILDLMGLKSMEWVEVLFRYSFIFSTAFGRALSSALLTFPIISPSLAVDANACSLSGLDAAVETLTAVTLVMNDSIGSTVSFVTNMMNDSHVTFNSFSRSFLLSTVLSITRMPPPMSCSTALLEEKVKRLTSPTMILRSWSLMCPKSRSFSSTINSASKGAICSRRMRRCLIIYSCPSIGLDWRATIWEACLMEAVVEATASWARPPKMLFGRHRYTFDSSTSDRCSGGYHSE
mmetsp:Transcript_36911/g.104163  ORF Transcript_36911/g.104163 Transcript_36911/m.104163 type:complete len:265 (+) Transcript_36911:187-981(+)